MKWKIKKYWLLDEVILFNPLGWLFLSIIFLFILLGGELELVEGY